MKVTIIGAGFSGSILALSLKKQNPPIASTIYETQSKNTPISGSVTLTANALRILDDIGIYNEIRLQGVSCERIHLRNQQLQPIGSLYNGDEKNHGYQALRIRRERVQEVLARQLEKQGVEVVYGMQCVKIEEIEGQGRVNVTFGTGKVVAAEYLVGADGIHSVVRRYVEKGSEARYQGSMNLSAEIEKSLLPSELVDLDLPCTVYGSTGTISLIPSDEKGDVVGVFATADYQDLGDRGWERMAAEKEKLKVILGGVYCMRDWPKPIRDLVKSLDPQRLYSWPHYAIPPLAHYNSESGNITLIGEGAHTMPRSGGQEVAMAMEDSSSLAHVIARCQSGQLRKPLLGIWERHRMQRVEWVALYSARTANYFRNNIVKDWTQMFKEWTMWACFWWLGEDGGMRWVYDYKAETVLALIKV